MPMPRPNLHWSGARYRNLVETLGDLSLTADVDPEGAAASLTNSRATQDLDAMLALLKSEERQNSRSEHSRNGSNGVGVDGGGSVDAEGGGGGGRGDLLAAPCLEFLLEERVVKVLCEMGSADRPAGAMALVLGAIASLLGQVRATGGRYDAPTTCIGWLAPDM